MGKNNNIYSAILAAAFTLTLIASGCGSNTGLSAAAYKTGATRSVDVRVPMPAQASQGAELNLEFLAGEMKLAPGGNEDLVSGSAAFNAAEFEPKVVSAGSVMTLRQGDLKVEDNAACPDDVENEWDLKIADVPLSLNIHAGAYDASMELGGLSLKKLSISESGSDFKGAFSAPNKVEMSEFTYVTGASKTELSGLANANFKQMSLISQAGDYTLSFDGDLRRDASVSIDAGAGTVSLIVPAGVNARVSFDGGLSTVNAQGEWKQRDGIYTLSGSGPILTIAVRMRVGTLNLKNEL